MSPGDIDRFLGGDDDQWPEDEGKAQWPKEKMSAGDVDAFLGPDSPGNDSDSSDGAEAPPPPDEEAPMSPGDIDRFLGGDDDQWPEDEGKAQWPKEKMSAGDVDAFLGPDSPGNCLLYTSPSPRDGLLSRMPSSA